MKENPFVISYALKQHTPLIHFQHDQAGATLRASELKPKLDKYLFSKLAETNIAVPESWLVGKGKAQHKALDYRVRVIDLDPRPTSNDNSVIIIPPESKKYVSSKNLQLEFFVMIPRLKEIIRDNLEQFFVIHNFGLRQNKGWGGFTLEDTNDSRRFESLLRDSGLLVFKRRRPSRVERFYLDVIESWHLLKSGKNHNGYQKSLLFKYMCSEGIRWEKRWIKKHLNDLIQNGRLPAKLQSRLPQPFPPIDCISGESGCPDIEVRNNSWEDAGIYDYRFARAMLGLPEHHEYRAKDNYIYQVVFKKSDGANIERFKAPVTFKFFEGYLYAIADLKQMKKDMEELKKGRFQVEIQVKENRRATGRSIQLDEELKMPQTFDLKAFLEEYFPCVNYYPLN